MRIFADTTARVAWLAMMAGALAGIAGVATFTSCEDAEHGYTGDPELVAVAQREGPRVAVAFGLRERATRCEWGERSCAWANEIEIDEAVRGRDAVVGEHVRHELLHRMSGEVGHPAEINGVRVRAVVPSWGAGGKQARK